MKFKFFALTILICLVFQTACSFPEKYDLKQDKVLFCAQNYWGETSKRVIMEGYLERSPYGISEDKESFDFEPEEEIIVIITHKPNDESEGSESVSLKQGTEPNRIEILPGKTPIHNSPKYRIKTNNGSFVSTGDKVRIIASIHPAMYSTGRKTCGFTVLKIEKL